MADYPVFDSSALKCFARCPRKFYWRYIRQLVPKHYKPAPLNFGSAIHEAMRIWYAEQDIDGAIEIFHKIWEDRFGDDKRTHEKGEKILKKYAETYPKEPFEIIGEPEMGFTVDLEGNEYVGRFDLVIEWNGEMYVLDHKTSSRMGYNYFHRYRPDFQMTGYTWAAEQVFDRPCAGVMINVLYFTKTKIDFFRDTSPRMPHEKQEFVTYATNRMANIKARNPDRMKDWEQKWVACTDWGTCQFRELCISAEPERLVPLMFKVEPWDPREEFDIDKIEKKKKAYDSGTTIRLIR